MIGKTFALLAISLVADAVKITTGNNPITWYSTNDLYGHVLDKSTGKVKAEIPTLVEFMQPRCPTCMEWAPIWKEIAEMKDVGVYEVASFDCTDGGKNAQTCQALGATSTPTIKLYLPGEDYAESATHFLPTGTLSRDRFLTWLNPRLPEISNGGDAHLMTAQTNVQAPAADVDASLQTAADTLGISIEEAQQLQQRKEAKENADVLATEAQEAQAAAEEATAAAEEAAAEVQESVVVASTPPATTASAAAPAAISTAPAVGGNHVLELSFHDFMHDVVNAFYQTKYPGPIVVEFYQPECPTCIAYKDTWDAIGEAAQNWGDITIARFNCIASNDAKNAVCAPLKVNQTPTIIYLKPGSDAKTSAHYALPPDNQWGVDHFKAWMEENI